MRLAPRFPTAGQPRRLARLGMANAAFWPGASVALDFTKNQGRVGLGYGSGPITSLPGWSFSRTGTEYAATSSGLLVPFASGVPAVTDLGLQIWEARTNIWDVAYNDTPANQWPTLANATVGAGTLASRVSGATSALLTTTGSSGRVQRNYALANDSVSRTFSVEVEKKSATYQVTLGYSGGTGVQQDVVFDGLTGSISSGAGTVTSAGSFWRVSVTKANNSTGNTLAFMFAMLQGASGQTANISLPMLEAAAFAGPYIAPLTGADATRGAASASVGGLSAITEAQGTLLVAWKQTRQKTEISGLASASVGSSVNDRAQIFLNSTGKVAWRFTAGGVASTINVDGSATAGIGNHKAALTWGSNGTLGYFDGASDATGDKPSGSTALDTVLAGTTVNTALPLNDTVARVVFFPQQMSAAQLASLTT